MRIFYASDVHLDFWMPPSKGNQKRKIEHFFATKFAAPKRETASSWLVIAGDIGHYDHQNEIFLSLMSKRFKRVFFVLGNHDLYVISKRQRSWRDRVERMKRFAESIENLYMLDGEVAEFDGVRIGGTIGWYDFSYGVKRGYSKEYILYLWNQLMHDSKRIKPKIDPFHFYQEEKEKLLSLKNCNVIVTHVPPVYIRNALYHDMIAAGSFYSFDGEEIVEKLSPSFWICGHNHEPKRKEVEIKNTKVVMSPLGYSDGLYAKDLFFVPSLTIR